MRLKRLFASWKTMWTFSIERSKRESKSYKMSPFFTRTPQTTKHTPRLIHPANNQLPLLQWTPSPPSLSHPPPLRRRASLSPTRLAGQATPTASLHRTPSLTSPLPTRLAVRATPTALSLECTATFAYYTSVLL